MKKYLNLALLVIALTAFNGHAQQITPQQQAVLDDFGLQANDHRGIEFNAPSTGCQVQYNGVKIAIEAFFATQVKRDYTIICVNSSEQQYFNQSYGIIDLVDIYIELINNQIESNE